MVSLVKVSHTYIPSYDACIGPLLLQDQHLIETLAHFVRERVPERCVIVADFRDPCLSETHSVVHAKAVGAHGYFEVTNADFAKNYTIM